MKNFETRCPSNGTSALQPRFEERPSKRGVIIAFPERTTASMEACSATRFPLASSIGDHFAQSDVLLTLRYGSSQGQSYDRVKPWQAVLTGVVFSTISLASLLLSL